MSAFPLAATWMAYWALWLLFAGSLAPDEAGMGLLVAGAVALMTRGPLLSGAPGLLRPGRILWFLAYLPYLAFAIVKANLQVARIVVDPALPIRPGIVRVRTRLKSRIGRLALANSITLTPGTLSVDIQDDELFIHWIVVESDDLEGATRAIVADFERYLEKIFG